MPHVTWLQDETWIISKNHRNSQIEWTYFYVLSWTVLKYGIFLLYLPILFYHWIQCFPVSADTMIPGTSSYLLLSICFGALSAGEAAIRKAFLNSLLWRSPLYHSLPCLNCMILYRSWLFLFDCISPLLSTNRSLAPSGILSVCVLPSFIIVLESLNLFCFCFFLNAVLILLFLLTSMSFKACFQYISSYFSCLCDYVSITHITLFILGRSKE